jgi:tetratricopeptide (TPR) repeat protein
VIERAVDPSAIAVSAALRPVGRSHAPAGHHGIAVLAALLAASSISCAARTETRSDVDQHSYSTSVSISGSRSGALLEQGRQAVSEGRFADGIAIFQSVYDMQDAKPEHREDALLALAQAHANVLNRNRDPQKALELYRKLLDEFPDTKKRYEIEQAMAALEKSSP